MDDEMKMEVAEKFSELYYGSEEKFVEFISKSDFAVVGDYRDTWKFIKKDNNSLNRCCNFHLFFK
jgi:uncharacterized protein (UPF0218 family)